MVIKTAEIDSKDYINTSVQYMVVQYMVTPPSVSSSWVIGSALQPIMWFYLLAVNQNSQGPTERKNQICSQKQHAKLGFCFVRNNERLNRYVTLCENQTLPHQTSFEYLNRNLL